MANEYLQALRDASMSELPALLRAQQAEAALVQREVLLDIVRTARDTAFGRAHGFADVRTVEDFLARVPETEWADYAQDAERLQEGAEDVLFPGRASAFIGTSGTTGKAKYIPDSAVGEVVKSEVVRLRTAEMMRNFPTLLQPDSRRVQHQQLCGGPRDLGRHPGGVPRRARRPARPMRACSPCRWRFCARRAWTPRSWTTSRCSTTWHSPAWWRSRATTWRSSPRCSRS